jgi:hypothetical protein
MGARAGGLKRQHFVRISDGCFVGYQHFDLL